MIEKIKAWASQPVVKILLIAGAALILIFIIADIVS